VLIAASICTVAPEGEGLHPRAYAQLKEVLIDSSAEQKKKLLHSSLFQLLHSLFPNGKADGKLSKGELRKVLKEYQTELDGAVDIARRHSAGIKAYFGRDPELQQIPPIRLVAEGPPSATTDSLYTTITIELLRDNLAAGVTDAKILSFAPATRDQLITDLYSLEENIRKAPASKKWTVIILNGEDSDRLSTLEDALDNFERGYVDATVFMLEHELGHKVLGHLDQPRSCSNIREQELAADRFAMYLIGLHAGETARKWLSPNVVPKINVVQPDITPSDVFFERSYRLAGFEDPNVSGCGYPPVAERMRLARAPYDDGYRAGFGNGP
jgi:hypothetical protein